MDASGDIRTADFFISRAGPDAGWAKRIAAILIDAGLKVVIQDQDIVNTSFMAAMQDALTSGARTIALLSREYLQRDHCSAEWLATLAPDPLNRQRRLIVLRIEDLAPPGLLGYLAYWDLVPLAGNDSLLEKVVLSATRPAAEGGSLAIDGEDWKPARAILHHEVRPTASFTGREGELDDIDAAVWGGETAAITQPVAVHGLGGVGKSALAREYAWRASQPDVDAYGGIWWLNASREAGGAAGIMGSLIELHRTLYPRLEEPQDRSQAAREMLAFIAEAAKRKPWLMIYDNVDDLDVLRTWGPPPGAQALITTRLTTFRAGAVTEVEIAEWAPPDAIAYLRRESGRALSEDEATALAEALGRLPLALSHAAAYLREIPSATPASYLKAIERHMAKAPPGMADDKPVYATFQEAIAQAEAFAAGAAAVMSLAAFYAPDNIPLELFEQAAEHYPAPLAAVVADEVAREQALGALARLSLIDLDMDARVLSTHRLVQAAVRAELASPSPHAPSAGGEGRGEGQPQAPSSDVAPHPSPLPVKDGEREQEWLTAAVVVCGEAYPGGDFRHWPAYERLLPHARHLAGIAGDDIGAPLALVLSQAGYYLNARAAYEEAEPFYKRSLDIREKALGPDHAQVGTALNNLAGLYRAQGKYDLAEPLHMRALGIREKALGPDHPQVGTSLNNLAGLYYAQGKYDLAEPIYKRALDISEKALGPDHPDVGTSLNNLAALYKSQGKYDLAEPLYMRALGIRKKALGPDHPNVGQSLNNLAVLYYHLKRLDDAAGMARRAHAIMLAALGAEHPETKNAANTLAGIEAAKQ